MTSTINPQLLWIADFVRQIGRTPTLGEIKDQCVNFREPGGIQRCLEALQAIAVGLISDARFRPGQIKRIADKAWSLHSTHDGESRLLVMTRQEFERFLDRELP